MAISDFWNDVDVEALNAGKIEAKAFDETPIPAGTKLPVMIEKIEWVDTSRFDGVSNIINVMWRVFEGAYERKVIFQKLLLEGETNFDKGEKAAKKIRKARTQFALMCKITGARGLLEGEYWPTDIALQEALQDKTFTIAVGVYNMKQDDGSTRSGNWVSGLEAYAQEPVTINRPEATGKEKVAVPSFHAPQAPKGTKITDDEIPF